MGAEENNMNERLSRIVAELFERSKGGEELSSRISGLRDEIKKIVESEDSIFGRLRGLMESFQEIIPDEKQRYNAAIKALSTTSKLSREEIVKAVNNQLEELKIVEKGLIPALPSWRDELKAMEARSKEMRDEITKLRERMAWLENEEKGILNGMATREKEMEVVEKAVKNLFTDIGAEITAIKKKVEEFTAETAAPHAAPQPIPPRESIKPVIPVEDKVVGEQKQEIKESSPPQGTEFQKKCPMCGGRMDFYINSEMWQCYSCAYELKKDEFQGTSEENNEQASAQKPTPASAPIFDPFPSLSSHEEQESKKESSPSSNQPPTKKKTCPVCHKKMQWHETERAWRCPFCDYERRI
jgi:ribosomal protein L37AE/L43A